MCYTRTMYVPKPFEVADRPTLLAFIETYPFGTFVSSVEGKPRATHAPFVVAYENDAVALALHVAKANPQWRDIDGQDVLAIFQGPHAMVSASWYEHPEAQVPTWDYMAVHCAGRARVADDARTLSILERLVERMEPSWRIGDARPHYIERLRGAIVGIDIAVTQITGAFKLSQNRSDEDARRVAYALETSPREADREIAREVRATRR